MPHVQQQRLTPPGYISPSSFRVAHLWVVVFLCFFLSRLLLCLFFVWPGVCLSILIYISCLGIFTQIPFLQKYITVSNNAQHTGFIMIEPRQLTIELFRLAPLAEQI